MTAPLDYGPVLGSLLASDRLMPLDDGTPDPRDKERLAAMTPQGAFAHLRNPKLSAAPAVFAGLWLYFDYLDESHAISQNIDNATGSFWHGIMHRREGDFGNSGYWFRRVGQHAIFADLVIKAAAITKEFPATPGGESLIRGGEWDPFRFIDLCQKAVGEGGDLAVLCQRIQLAEWRLLFDYSYRQVSGESD